MIEFYLLMKITAFFDDKIILLFVSNIIIFYSVLEKKFPYFVFKTRMAIKQIIEGIIVLILCAIPGYEEKSNEKENDDTKKKKSE